MSTQIMLIGGLSATIGLIVGLYWGDRCGYSYGIRTGWAQCKQAEWLRATAERNARRDPATGRFRRAQR